VIKLRWPVVNLKDKFQFACHPGLPCFTECCRRLEVILTPYDILRLKKALNISSESFLERYTEVIFPENIGLPMLKLKKQKNCPFLGEKGCLIYSHRPSVCRLYPLGSGFSSKKRVYFLIKEPECLGFQAKKTITVGEWINSQGLKEYEEMNALFAELIFLKNKIRPVGLTVKETKMFFMSCYNLDSFREFVLKSSFCNRFDLTPKHLRKIEKNDTFLLKLAFDWLKFALFGQPTLKLKNERIPSH